MFAVVNQRWDDVDGLCFRLRVEAVSYRSSDVRDLDGLGLSGGLVEMREDGVAGAEVNGDSSHEV